MICTLHMCIVWCVRFYFFFVALNFQFYHTFSGAFERLNTMLSNTTILHSLINNFYPTVQRRIVKKSFAFDFLWTNPFDSLNNRRGSISIQVFKNSWWRINFSCSKHWLVLVSHRQLALDATCEYSSVTSNDVSWDTRQKTVKGSSLTFPIGVVEKKFVRYTERQGRSKEEIKMFVASS